MDLPEQTASELLDLTEGKPGEKVAFRLKVDKAEVDTAIRKIKNVSLVSLIAGIAGIVAGAYGAFASKLPKWGKVLSGLGAAISVLPAAIGGLGLKAINSGELRKKVTAIETGEVIVMDKAEFEKQMQNTNPQDRARIEMVDLKDVPEMQQNHPAARNVNFTQMLTEQSAQLSQLVR